MISGVMKLWNLLLYIPVSMLFVLTVVAAYGGYVDPNISPYFSILKLVFPFFIVATLLVGLLLLVFRRRVMALLSVIVLLICFPQIQLIFPVNYTADDSQDEKQFTLMDYNIYYGFDIENPDAGYSRSVSSVINSGADIVCLQELYSLNAKVSRSVTDSQVDSLRSIYRYEIAGNSVDVVLLSKYPAKRLPVPDFGKLQYFMYDAYSVDIDGTPLTIINLHLSSFNLDGDERDVVEQLSTVEGVKESARQMKDSILSKLSYAFQVRAEAARIIRQYADSVDGNLIICGDFNDVTGSWAYRTIVGDDMRDAYVDAGCGAMSTYHANNMLFHIDHILYRGDIKAIDFEKGDVKSSDHYPIFVKFAVCKELKDKNEF